MIKNCQYCGKEFDSNTTWQLYCSDRCKVADFRRKQKQEQQDQRSQQKQKQQAK